MSPDPRRSALRSKRGRRAPALALAARPHRGPGGAARLLPLRGRARSSRAAPRRNGSSSSTPPRSCSWWRFRWSSRPSGSPGGTARPTCAGTDRRRAGGRARSRPQAAQRPLLRHGRVHELVGAPQCGGDARADRRLPGNRRGRGQAVWRLRREVSGRRRPPGDLQRYRGMGGRNIRRLDQSEPEVREGLRDHRRFAKAFLYPASVMLLVGRIPRSSRISKSNLKFVTIPNCAIAIRRDSQSIVIPHRLIIFRVRVLKSL